MTRDEASAIKSEVDKTAARVSEVFETISKTFAERGSGSALRDTASVWNMEVAGKASGQAGVLKKDQLDTDNNWSGAAAEAYADVVSSQNSALTLIKTIVDTLGTTLNEFANALTEFWFWLLFALAVYVAGMVTAIATVLTGAGAVAGLITAATLSVGFVTAVAELKITFTNAIETQKASLDRQATMNGAFPNSVWPPAVTDTMSDASIKDGDKSDWIPKP